MRTSMKKDWARLVLLIGALTAGLVIGLGPIGARVAGAQVMSLNEEKAFWEDHFKNVPDVGVKGSGWKPFNRWLWFYEPRVDPTTGFVPTGARWQAYLDQQQIIRQNQNQYLRPNAVWTNLGPVNIAGRCTPIAIDPLDHTHMFIGAASGGLWVTSNAGASWEPVDDNLPTLAVGAILFDENTPSTIYIGTGEGNFSSDAIFGVGVMRSTDGGLTWSIHGTGLDWQIGDGKCVEKLVMDPTNGVLIAATTAGVYRLDNTGTWTQTLAGTATGLLRHPTNTSEYYAVIGKTNGGTANGFYKSIDDGLTWTKITGTGWPATHGRADIALCTSQPNILYAGITVGSSGVMLGIYKSTDGGENWVLANNSDNHYGGQGWYDLVIAVDPTNPNKVYSGGIDIWTSTNGGTTFTHRTQWNLPPGNPQYVHADQHGWAFHPDNPAHVYACCDGGVFESFDSGINWDEITTGMTTMQFYDIDVAQNNVGMSVGGTQDNGTNVRNGTDSWMRSLGGDGFHCNIDYSKADTLYEEYYNGNHHRSYNGGNSLSRIMSGIGENGAWDTPVHLDYQNTAILYTAHQKIYKTTNRGSLWVAKSGVLPGLGSAIAQAPSDPTVLYCGYSAIRNIHLSTDRGETWSNCACTGLPGRVLMRLKVHPTIPSTVYATYSGFSTNNVWKSTDSGSTWTSISGNLPALPVGAIAIDPLDPNVIYVGTDLGVWRTEDAGVSWLPYGVGLPNAVIGDLKIVENQRLLRAGTYGRGLWETTLTAAGSSSVQESTTPSSRLSIVDVFPNPLRVDKATVRFSLPAAGRVRVQLFDATGRLVETPLDRDLSAGTHRVEWPSRAPSGVYFVKVHQGHGVSTGKLIIQR